MKTLFHLFGLTARARSSRAAFLALLGTTLTQPCAPQAAAADLLLRSDITGSAPAGGLTVSHTVWNPGTALVPGVWLTNTLPPGVSFRATNRWPFPGGTGPTYPPPPDPPILFTAISPGVTFGPPVTATKFPAPAVAITDLNLDGYPDFAVPHGGNWPGLSLYLCNSTNIPRSVPTTLPTPTPGTNGLRVVSVGDFNGDGLPDLVAADAVQGKIYVYPQVGPVATGANFTFGPVLDFPSPISAIEVMDLDGDGLDDLVVLEPAGKVLHLLVNTEFLGLPGFLEVNKLPTPPEPTALGRERRRPGRESPTLASLGRLYVTSPGNGGTLTVFVPTGNADPANLYLPGVDFPAGPTPTALAIADLDGDGIEDVAVANGAARSVTLLAGDAAGGYAPIGELPVALAAASDVQVLDLDGDGRPEILLGATGEMKLAVLPNSRDSAPLHLGQFGHPVFFALPAPFGRLGYDTFRDGSQAGGFVVVAHGEGAAGGGATWTALPLIQPGPQIAVPLGDLAPGAAAGVSLDLEVRIPDATNSVLARAPGTGIGIGPIKDPIPLRSVCGKLYCVSGGLTQGMGGFVVSVVISGTGYYYSNSVTTLADGSYCIDMPFSCGGVFPWDAGITVTSAGCPGQVLNVPLINYLHNGALPPLLCGNCNACTNVQQTLALNSGSGPSGLLAVGALDPQFTTGNPPFANANPYVTGAAFGWLPDGPGSQWIGPDLAFQSLAGIYCYTNSFYLPCTNRAWLHGQWTLAGSGGAVWLNGAATAISLSGSGLETAWHPFSLTSGFVVGWNTLVFCVTNPPSSAGTAFNPTGLRTEISGTALCCAGCTEIRCPTNQIVEICTNGPAPYGAVVNYPTPVALSHCGYLTNLSLVPPPGSWFPLGTNLVVATATDSLGNSATCTFAVIVRADFTPPTIIRCPDFNVTVTGCPPVLPWVTNGLIAVDNCSGPAHLTVSQLPPPGTILTSGQSSVVVRVCDAAGNCHDCDVIVTAVPTGGVPSITCPPPLTFYTCSNSAIANFSASAVNATGISYTPPPGTAFTLGTTWVTCTATNVCGGVASCTFPVTVLRPPWRFACLQVGIGIPFEPVGGAIFSFSANPETPDTPTFNLIPAPGVPSSGLRLVPGPAQSIRFTTLLDANAPDGAGFELRLPPAPGTGESPKLGSITKAGAKYVVRQLGGAGASADAPLRSYAVNTNGDLLDPFTFSPAEAEALATLEIGFMDGVSNCHVTVEFNLVDGSSTVEFDGSVMPTPPSSARHKGWDGCIYGPDRPRPKPPKTARVVLIPPTQPPGPAPTEVFLYAAGWPQMPLEDVSISTRGDSAGHRWADRHVIIIKADDEGHGVEMSLGQTRTVRHSDFHHETFEFAVRNFSTNPPAGEQFISRTVGPIRALTNRPAPPFLDALSFEVGPLGVAGSADFQNLESPTVRLELILNGELARGLSGLPAGMGQPLFFLPQWPQRIGGFLQPTLGRTIKFPACDVILPGGTGLPPEVVTATEIRILAELPAGAPPPDFFSEYEFGGSDGADWGVRLLESTPAFTPIPLSLTPTADGSIISWDNAEFRLQGAVDAAGPWFDLGVSSPLALPADRTARFYRLVCD